MNEAERIFDAAVQVAIAITGTPEMRAYYAELARREREKRKRMEAEAKAERDAIAAEKARAKAYDVWALSGGSDECTQFGIMDGCKPWCPVFARGKCHIQEENEEAFASEALTS